ncbi:hypothetical protein [Vibrio penaeicida]|uniref:Uncharacterized protein n=1 Tax=Vibrio penaeicida TaxID=104609 RepID=A0AAV5NSI4_9VIBR|nr:hypothetical protein [Vibrio penaeicida]GLQ73289.1 hypothetical protein GCM10007932_26490 [Vibrio penaeicida]
MESLPLNQEYRAAFENVIVLLRAESERGLSQEELKQLDAHISACRLYENQRGANQ